MPLGGYREHGADVVGLAPEMHYALRAPARRTDQNPDPTRGGRLQIERPIYPAILMESSSSISRGVAMVGCRWIVLLLLAGLLTNAGCGGDSDEEMSRVESAVASLKQIRKNLLEQEELTVQQEYVVKQIEAVVDERRFEDKDSLPLLVYATGHHTDDGTIVIKLTWIEPELVNRGYYLQSESGHRTVVEDGFEWDRDDHRWYSDQALIVESVEMERTCLPQGLVVSVEQGVKEDAVRLSEKLFFGLTEEDGSFTKPVEVRFE
jgi:hypothetical protein